MDQEAAVEELNRLSKIGVIEEFAESGASGSEIRMDLREVYDWRYRDGKWRRRCRIVAREYRAGATSTAETFSPTASKRRREIGSYLAFTEPNMGHLGVGHQRCVFASTPAGGSPRDNF